MVGSGQYSNPFDHMSTLLEYLDDNPNTLIELLNSKPVTDLCLPVRQKRLSDEVKKQIVERYKAGESVLSITETFGIHRCTLFVIIKKAGVSRKK